MITPRVGLYAVYEPPEEGWEHWQEQLTTLGDDLQKQGLQVVFAPEAVHDLGSCERVGNWVQGQALDVLVALIASWSFDHYSFEIQQKTRLPLAIRSVPGIRSGSLVAGQQLNCLLTDLEIEHRLFFGALGNADVAQEMAHYARACAVVKALRGARMAVVGRRTEGMTPTAVDEIEIMRLFGVRLIHIGLDELYALRDTIPVGEAEKVWQACVQKAQTVTAQPAHGIQSMQNYLALKKLWREMGLSALSIGSYPHCQGTMCLPIALLNDDGLPSGCEGDVNSTLAMLILSMLGNGAVHFGEMLDIDEGENTLISSHCGCGSPSLAENGGFILCPVRLANNGVCVRYPAKPGEVTLVNLVGRKGNYRLCAIEGEARTTGMVFEGNPMKIHMNAPFREIWKLTRESGFGHHWMTVYRHVGAELNQFCRLVGIKGVVPGMEAE